MNFSKASEILRRDGIALVLRRKIDWYRQRFKGGLIAARGNRIRMDGMVYSVAFPHFTSTLKATIAGGRYEWGERHLVRSWLPADVPLIELGGGLGAVSCLANRRLADRTRHVVVEANPSMVPVLETNRDLNGCGFTVVNKALGYGAESLSLEIDADFVGSSAAGMISATNGKVEVPTTSVEALMRDHGFDQVGIVCDIEGTEAELIAREFPVLGDRVRYIMAETHPAILGRDANEAMLRSLATMGFTERERFGDCVFYSRG